jgi:hypothetical protein
MLSVNELSTFMMSPMRKVLLAGVAVLFLATGTAQADNIAAECGRFDQQCIKKERSIAACDLFFDYGYLLPGNQIGACYAKATNNRCDGSLDGSKMQVCTDWVEAHPKLRKKRK